MNIIGYGLNSKSNWTLHPWLPTSLGERQPRKMMLKMFIFFFVFNRCSCINGVPYQFVQLKTEFFTEYLQCLYNDFSTLIIKDLKSKL